MSAPTSPEETPYEQVRRLRSEAADDETVRTALLVRGLDPAEIGLLLEQPFPRFKLEPEPQPSSEETPWALVQRRLAEGFPREQIEAELRALGHPIEDIRAVLVDDPRFAKPGSGRPGQATSSGGASIQLIYGTLLLVAGGLLLASGVIGLWSIGLLLSGIFRIVSAVNSTRGIELQQQEAQRSLRELPADDQRSRCAVHASLASLGSCPRCGNFCCAKCTPLRGFASGSVCMRCQTLPDVLAARERRAARQAALFLLSAPAMIAILFMLDVVASPNVTSSALSIVLVVLALSVPWLVLAALQAFTRTVWPTVLSVVPWLALGLALLFLTEGRALLQFMMWILPLGGALGGWLGLKQARDVQPALVPE